MKGGKMIGERKDHKNVVFMTVYGNITTNSRRAIDMVNFSNYTDDTFHEVLLLLLLRHDRLQ